MSETQQEEIQCIPFIPEADRFGRREPTLADLTAIDARLVGIHVDLSRAVSALDFNIRGVDEASNRLWTALQQIAQTRRALWAKADELEQERRA